LHVDPFATAHTGAVQYIHTYQLTQNLLQSTVLDAGIVLDFTATP